MGYIMVHSPCIVCKEVFAYNPHKVPSTSKITGQREPICLGCFDRINKRREAQGLQPFQMLPGAYDPIDEREL